MIGARFLMTLVATTAFASAVPAQQTGTSPARSDVKAEARAATKNGTTAEGEVTAGEASAPQGGSEKSRGQVKEEAKAVVRSGDPYKAKGAYEGGMPPASGASAGKSRRAVKAEARSAAKSGTTAEGEIGSARRGAGSAGK